MNWLIFIAATLACFRLTRLITDDKIMDWLRALVVRKVPREIKRKAKEGITCPFCVSFYWAVFIAFALDLLLGLPRWSWLLWFAPIWGGSVLWNQLFVRLSDES